MELISYTGELEWVQTGALYAPLKLQLVLPSSGQDWDRYWFEFHSEANLDGERTGSYRASGIGSRTYRHDPSRVRLTTPRLRPYSRNPYANWDVWLKFELTLLQDSRNHPFCFVHAEWCAGSESKVDRLTGLLPGTPANRNTLEPSLKVAGAPHGWDQW